MAEYTEILPGPQFARNIECFWSIRPTPGDAAHRVIPDGCTDLVFNITGGRVRGSAVGSMTRAIMTPAAAHDEIFGVRFHPGMSHGLLRVPVPLLTDQVIDLEDIWGADARTLEQQLADTQSPADRLRIIQAYVEPANRETPVQRAALWIVENRGNASVDQLSRHIGLSARQFRRLCIEQTGVGPKMLCRVVRFRNAANDVARFVGPWADFALDHGYYDQAHFINEFREFSGVTPSEYMTVFSNTQAPPAP